MWSEARDLSRLEAKKKTDSFVVAGLLWQFRVFQCRRAGLTKLCPMWKSWTEQLTNRTNFCNNPEPL
jgi:hypothetical protein